jgi:hypothetical protein
MKKRDKRVAIFHRGAAALAKYRNGDTSLYLCPICCKGFTEGDAEAGVLVSLEHVPPQSLGGKPLLLTCSECNSESGRKTEFNAANLANLKSFGDIVTGNSEGTVQCILNMGGEKVAVSLSRKAGATEFRACAKANNPAALERLNGHMKALSNDEKWDGEQFNITKKLKLDYRLLRLAFLKSGFLLVSAWLGYGFVLDSRLDIVRDQIMRPEENLLDSFWFLPEKDTGLPAKRIVSVTDPLAFFLVNFDDGAVILPSPASPTNLYQIINRLKNTKTTITGTIYSWPERATMFFDAPHPE